MFNEIKKIIVSFLKFFFVLYFPLVVIASFIYLFIEPSPEGDILLLAVLTAIAVFFTVLTFLFVLFLYSLMLWRKILSEDSKWLYVILFSPVLLLFNDLINKKWFFIPGDSLSSSFFSIFLVYFVMLGGYLIYQRFFVGIEK